jgi:hypothetical protein
MILLGFKMSLLTIILTFVILAGGIGTETAYGQSSAPFANCISLFMEGDAVQLSEDEDCNSSQWQEAVQYYKANGYPNEESYMDMLGSKFIQLSSDKWVQEQADLDEYLKENK